MASNSQVKDGKYNSNIYEQENQNRHEKSSQRVPSHIGMFWCTEDCNSASQLLDYTINTINI